MIYAGYMLMGLAAGFLSALLGIGGGVVVVPILVIFFAMDMKLAIGTSLAYIVPVALCGAVQHGFNRNVDLRVVALAVPFGFVGAYLGVRLCNALPAPMLKRVFGLLLLAIGLRLLIVPQAPFDVLERERSGPHGDGGAPVQPRPPQAQDGS